MFGFSICCLLIRSFISLARSALLPDVSSFTCRSVRILGTAPGPIAGQSRPAAWPRPGRQTNTPHTRSANAQHFHRRLNGDKGIASGMPTWRHLLCETLSFSFDPANFLQKLIALRDVSVATIQWLAN